MLKLRTCLLALVALAPVARAETASPLLVVIEGYSSCEETPGDPVRPLWGPATEQLTRLTQGRAPRVLYACFGFVDSGWAKFLGPIDLRWTVSREPAVVHRATFDQPFADRLIAEVESGQTPSPLAALALAVHDEIAREPGQPVYVVGHSYGGWTAMRLLLELGQPVAGLVTVDPISPVSCNFGTTLAGHLDTPDGCRQFPADFAVEQRRSLAKLTRHWSHFYQDQYEYLHSGFVAEAETSERLTLEGTDLFTNSAHNRIIMDDRVWAGVRSLMSME